MNSLSKNLRDIQQKLRPMRHDENGKLNPIIAEAIKSLGRQIDHAEQIEEAIEHGDQSADTVTASSMLDRFIRSFSDYTGSGITLDGDNVTEFLKHFKIIKKRTKALEHELSKWRWNAKGDLPDAMKAQPIIGQEGDNIIRPLFGKASGDAGGRTGGGAA